MGGVAREEDAASAVARDLPVMEPEMREPRRVANDDRALRGKGDDRLQLLERQRTFGRFVPAGPVAPRLGASDGDSDDPPGGRRTQRKEDGGPTFAEERIDGAGLERAVSLHVAQHEILQVAATLEGEPGPASHDAVCAIATDEIASQDLLLVTVGTSKQALDEAFPTLELDQLHTSLDGDTLTAEVLHQEPLGLRLRDEEDERVPGVLGAELGQLHGSDGPRPEMDGHSRAGAP